MKLNALGVVLLRFDRARPLGERHQRSGVSELIEPVDDHHERSRARRHAHDQRAPLSIKGLLRLQPQTKRVRIKESGRGRLQRVIKAYTIFKLTYIKERSSFLYSFFHTAL